MSADELLILNMIRALLATELIELLGAYALCVRKKGDIFCIALVNAATNLPLNFLIGMLRKTYAPSALFPVIILGETAVFLLEAYVYIKRRIDSKVRPLTLSVILNTASLTLGSLFLSLF